MWCASCRGDGLLIRHEEKRALLSGSMRLQVPVPLQRAFAVLSWERAVPAFLPLFVGALAVFALLWSGLISGLPMAWHMGLLALCGILVFILFGRGARQFVFPRRGETLRRIEDRSDLRPGILDGVWARPFASAENNPLWIESRERLIQSIGTPKVPLPRVDIRRIDPYRLRYGALGLVGIALIATGGRPDGLRASLTPPLPPATPVIVDAWIEPPAYTQLPPRIFKLTRPKTSIAVATGSRLHLRMREEDGTSVRGVLTFQTAQAGRRRIRPEGEDNSQLALTLDQTGLLAVNVRGSARMVQVYVQDDNPPSVALVGEPETATGVIRLDVETTDDYPLAEGMLRISLLPGQRISTDAPAPDKKVVDTPDQIDLPSLAGQPGMYRIEAASEDHPWAGLLVKAVIEVKDGLGQRAETEPFAFTMPERTFYNPLSRSVIEERRKLAMAPNSLNRSAKLFGAMTEAPDIFDVPPSDHLMMKATAEAVAAAKVRDVPDIIESLWPLAIELEDDGLAFAKAQLDAAEEALREALRNGASQEEIAQRIADLRQAMNEYIRALAESGYGESDPGTESQALGEADLEELLRRMEELSEQGARSEAESLLAQLEALLQSLQLSRSQQGEPGGEGQGQPGQGQPGQMGQNGQGQGGEGAQSLSGTGDLIQEQRELTDQTFSARRGDRGAGGLGLDQRDLSEQLQSLMDGLPDDAGDARGSFGEAEESMNQAADALENGNLALAQALQERALQQLREAGNELADALGQGGDDVSQAGADPLGRAFDNNGGADPEDFGLYDPERIRQLIAEIRRRLEDPNLGDAERTYLESLLERF